MFLFGQAKTISAMWIKFPIFVIKIKKDAIYININNLKISFCVILIVNEFVAKYKKNEIQFQLKIISNKNSIKIRK